VGALYASRLELSGDLPLSSDHVLRDAHQRRHCEGPFGIKELSPVIPAEQAATTPVVTLSPGCRGLAGLQHQAAPAAYGNTSTFRCISAPLEVSLQT